MEVDMRSVFLIIFILFLGGCAEKTVDFVKDVHKLYKDKYSGKKHTKKRVTTYKRTNYTNSTSYSTIIANAEKKATPQARRVLIMARKMVEKREIIRGACWDYLNSAFTRAGYPHSKRRVIFKSKKRGPYAKSSIIRPRDWVYHINYSYHKIEHSGMFIDWINYNKKIALMLSYAGERRREPARYKPYNLSSVYNIMRAK